MLNFGSLNKTELIGNVGRLEFKEFGDFKIAEFSIATSNRFKKKEEWVEETEWHNCKCFGKDAEMMEKYVKKGDKIYIQGSIRTEKWEKDGEEKSRKVIEVRELVISLRNKSQDDPKKEDKGVKEKPNTTTNYDDNDDLPF